MKDGMGVVLTEEEWKMVKKKNLKQKNAAAKAKKAALKAKKEAILAIKEVRKKEIKRGAYKNKGIVPAFGDTVAKPKFGDENNKPKFGI